MELIEGILLWIEGFQHLTPFLLFGLLLLAGLNIPISEDAILIVGGVVASSNPLPEALFLYSWILLGAYLSAWEAFGLGRWLGPSFLKDKHRMRAEAYFAKHGKKTLFLGRFIPFGFRNALFMTAGMSGMPFSTFALRDIPGCFVSTIWLFIAAYYTGRNYEQLQELLHSYHTLLLTLLCIAGLYLGFRFLRNRRIFSKSTN